MRYDLVFDSLARHALGQVEVDLQAFFEAAARQRMDLEAIQRNLIEDLENEGPIFGKFVRHLVGAAENSVVEAGRQGAFVGELSGSDVLNEIENVTQEDIDAAINAADPQLLDDIEDKSADRVLLTWIAELVNTCHKCLPLHGVTMFKSEWEARGLSPATRHDGWVSVCHCHLVLAKNAADRKDLVAPLTRIKLQTTTGKKGSRNTARAVTQQDVDKALRAVQKSIETESGRRTLRLLGKSGSTLLIERQGTLEGPPQ